MVEATTARWWLGATRGGGWDTAPHTKPHEEHGVVTDEDVVEVEEDHCKTERGELAGGG